MRKDVNPSPSSLFRTPRSGSGPTAIVTEDKIELQDSVYFGHGSAEIETRSHSLLDSITQVITAHPELELIVVEGHTDSTGKAFYNRRLSTLRAEPTL